MTKETTPDSTDALTGTSTIPMAAEPVAGSSELLEAHRKTRIYFVATIFLSGILVATYALAAVAVVAHHAGRDERSRPAIFERGRGSEFEGPGRDMHNGPMPSFDRDDRQSDKESQ